VRASETPIFATMISELGQQRAEALGRVAELRGLLADLEALHEPDGDGDCPACMAPAPCVTMLLLRGDIDSEQAFGVLAGAQVIDLATAERESPRVPSLTELLAQPTRGMDRFFDALLGLPHPADRAS
jgi:hypothetical protein